MALEYKIVISCDEKYLRFKLNLVLTIIKIILFPIKWVGHNCIGTLNLLDK